MTTQGNNNSCSFTGTTTKEGHFSKFKIFSNFAVINLFHELPHVLYQYGPKFCNWLLVFLKNAQADQTTGTNQNFIICRWYFSFCYLFVSCPVFCCVGGLRVVVVA